MALYNNMANLPNIPYQIIKFLATDTSEYGEVLWKLIKYNSYDALSKDNLTTSQKLDLIWKSGKQEDYSVFFTNLIEDVIPESKCVLKIYSHVINPDNLYTAVTVYAFDFLYGGKMSLVEYNGIPVNRGDLFITCIMAILNGQVVGGVGRFAMDDDMSGYCGAKTVVGNQKTFTGVQLFLGTLVGNDSSEEDCGT